MRVEAVQAVATSAEGCLKNVGGVPGRAYESLRCLAPAVGIQLIWRLALFQVPMHVLALVSLAAPPVLPTCPKYATAKCAPNSIVQSTVPAALNPWLTPPAGRQSLRPGASACPAAHALALTLQAPLFFHLSSVLVRARLTVLLLAIALYR